MGSSCEANGKSIDSTVGGLVWVRRRNGSWWPGRILGADELPESCLVSPRSGTPVKLLGREDASVDWYNLEKSKRVKAFRCGEYDECIEKAKVTAAISCKKAVKYARREDAILHALELENARLSKHFPETIELEKSTSQQPNNSHTHEEEEEEENEATSDKLSSLEYISNELESSPCGVSVGDDNNNNKDSLKRQMTQISNDNEEDGIEGSKKRMKGLKDLGIVKKTSSLSSSIKRRRSQVAHVHEFLKKKNRRRQLTKVLESTAMVTVPVMCEELTNYESKRSFSVVINNNNSDSTGDVSNNNGNCKQKENEISSGLEFLESDSCGRLFDVPFISEEEKEAAGLFSASISEKHQVNGGGQSGQSSLVETVSVGPDELQESGSISSGATAATTTAAAAAANLNIITHSNATSKWQHKGKRNSRTKTKRINSNLLPPSDEQKSDQVNESNQQRSTSYRQSRFTVNPKVNDTESLYDVNIEVKVGHSPLHIPYISLMSKLTGQPITGHPIVVEVLSESVSSECEDNNNNIIVQEGVKKSKRNGVLCNKKIRRLSSLTGGSKQPIEKTGKFKKPGDACVPVKLVFGRIDDALGKYLKKES